jgi:hypothetical protein
LRPQGAEIAGNGLPTSVSLSADDGDGKCAENSATTIMTDKISSIEFRRSTWFSLVADHFRSLLKFQGISDRDEFQI